MPELADPLELLEPLGQLALFDIQPTPQSWIWQANQLAVARYQLGEVEQKLLLYAIAMIDGKDAAFSTYRIHVAAYAEACGIGTGALYAQLKEAAKSIKAKPLLITGHISKEGKVVDLLTSWFAEVEFGVGYIDVMFPPSLRRYLLGVRSEFYKFELAIPLHLSGEYAIRLYQFCKRWKFTGRSKTIQVGDLRMTLGLIELDAQGNPSKERLPKYGDMKKWALLPALAEIERASDILVRMKEKKKPGTKLVEAIDFVILDNPKFQSVSDAPKLKAAVQVDPVRAVLSATLLSEFALSPEQARMVMGKYPLAFIEQKAAIVRARPCDNMAAVLLAALRDDYQPAKSNKPAKNPKKPAAPDPVAEGTKPRIKVGPDAWAAMKRQVKGGPKLPEEGQSELTLASAA